MREKLPKENLKLHYKSNQAEVKEVEEEGMVIEDRRGGYNNNEKESQVESSNSQKSNNNHGSFRGGYNNIGRVISAKNR
jgi:hypothetical protein